MLKVLAVLAAPALLLSTAVQAQTTQPETRVDLYFSQSTLDAAGGDEDYQGFGIRAQGRVADTLFLRGEYGRESVKGDGDGDIDLIRVGLGPSFPAALRGQVRGYGLIEFDQLRVNAPGAKDVQSGIGGIVGAAATFGLLNASLETGYISLEDLSGPYVGIDVGYDFASSSADHLGFFAGLRQYWLDDDGTSADIGQLQLGLRYTW